MAPVWNTMGQLLAHILNMRTALRKPTPQAPANNNTNLFGVPQDQQAQQQPPAVKSQEEIIMERAKKLIHIEDLDDNLRDVTAIMWTVLRKNKEKPHFVSDYTIYLYYWILLYWDFGLERSYLRMFFKKSSVLNFNTNLIKMA